MSGRFGAVRDMLRKRMVEETVPSLAVAVAQHGEIVWEEGFGWADRESRTPATPHTLYSLASISKPMTATAIMALVEEGLVDLDRPINDYLAHPGVTARTGRAEDATVRRVCDHTSGLPLHYHFFPVDEPHRRPPMEETIRRYGQLVTLPGERYQYSNIGYGILDHVIARTSGKSYTDFMRERIFLPLGMTRASVDIAPGLEPHAAARYRSDGTRLPFYDFDHPGASAVYCSAHDLVRFGLFHLKARLADQKAILSDASIDRMQAPSSEVPEGAAYGIGWSLGEEVPGCPLVMHTGGMAGVSTLLALLPSQGVAVAALCNTNSGLAQHAVEAAAGVLVEGLCERLAEARAEKEAQAERAKREAPEFRPAPALAGEWRGAVHTYEREVPVTLRFRASGDVHVQVGDQLTTLLNEPDFKEGRLTGRTLGDIGTEDAARRPYELRVDLTLRGETLNRAITALSLPGKRPGNALTQWAELQKI